MLGDRDQKLNKRDIDADIQDVLTQKVQKKVTKNNGISFNSVGKDTLFQFAGQSWAGKVFKKAGTAYAREVIRSTKLGIEQLGDYVACISTDFVFPVELK